LLAGLGTSLPIQGELWNGKRSQNLWCYIERNTNIRDPELGDYGKEGIRQGSFKHPSDEGAEEYEIGSGTR